MDITFFEFGGFVGFLVISLRPVYFILITFIITISLLVLLNIYAFIILKSKDKNKKIKI